MSSTKLEPTAATQDYEKRFSAAKDEFLKVIAEAPKNDHHVTGADTVKFVGISALKLKEPKTALNG